jgi:hypothetical protein
VRKLAAAGLIETRHVWRRLLVNGVWYPVRPETRTVEARIAAQS